MKFYIHVKTYEIYKFKKLLQFKPIWPSSIYILNIMVYI